MSYTLAVIGVGNMAKAIISGISSSDISISEILVFDKNPEQYHDLPKQGAVIRPVDSITSAISQADCVLLSVKPQNFPEILSEISTVPSHTTKLYISIAAGLSSKQISDSLGGACVVRVLPNVPILIGQGVSVICENPQASVEQFELVCSVFRCAGSIIQIDETEMNRMIAVTSSSPAYVFQFINAIYQGALEQQLPDRNLLDTICDVVIGSAMLLKNSQDTPAELIAKVASKGGTTERALAVLQDQSFDDTVKNAMLACTNRADELGVTKK